MDSSRDGSQVRRRRRRSSLERLQLGAAAFVSSEPASILTDAVNPTRSEQAVVESNTAGGSQTGRRVRQRPSPLESPPQQTRAETNRQNARRRVDLAAEESGAAMEAERLSAEVLERRVSPRPRSLGWDTRHINVLKPHLVPAHVPLARLAARAMGVILDENGDTTQRSYWSSLLQMRTRILDEGKHLRLAYDKALEKPLFEKGHYFEGADTNDPADMKKRNASYKLDYAIRRFELDDMTSIVLKCEVCNKVSSQRGVFSHTSSDEFWERSGAKKFIFQVPDPSRHCGFTYRYEYRRDASLTWIELNDVCRTCFSCLSSSCGESKIPAFSLPNGFSHGVSVPEVLTDVSFAEEAMIARIQPAMAAAKLKGGGRKLIGHVAFFDRTNEVKEIAALLPWLPSDVNVIELQREAGSGGRFREFRVRRHKVEGALAWLCKHSVAYSGVTIDYGRIQSLPLDGDLEVGVVSRRHGDSCDSENRGPAPGQHEDGEEESFIQSTHGGTIEGASVRTTDMAARITDEATRISNAGGTSTSTPRVIHRHAQFLRRWDEIEYFFGMTFPTCFMPEELNTSSGPPTADLPADWCARKPRDRPFAFFEWVEHLMSIGRYQAHDTLPFALVNLKQKKQSMNQTQFGLRQMPGDAPLDLDEVRDLMKSDPNQVSRLARSITAYTTGITDTPAYWWARRQEVGSLVRHMEFYHNELPVAFHSGSMAEYHWPGLWLRIHQALVIEGQHEKARAIEHLRTRIRVTQPPSNFTVHSVILGTYALQNQYFVHRTEAWFKIVVHEGLGMTESWRRCEFAKERGTVHFHSICYNSDAASEIHGCLDPLASAISYDWFMSELNSPEEETPTGVHRSVADNLATVLPRHFPEYTALHPAGRTRSQPGAPYGHLLGESWYAKRVEASNGTLPSLEVRNIAVQPDVPNSHIGDVDRWPPHEGRGPPPTHAPLRSKLYEVPRTEEEMDRIDFHNRTMLHCCSSYCLRVQRTGKGEDARDLVTCRMHFGEENPGVLARTNGKPARKDPCVVINKGVLQIELPRDHPRFVQNPLGLTRGYGGNADMQPILGIQNDTTPLPTGVSVLQSLQDLKADLQSHVDSDPEIKKAIMDLWNEMPILNKAEYLERLIDYVVAYACKGEISSVEAAEMFRQIADSSLDGSTPLATLAQKMNMKLLKERELPIQEAVFNCQRLPLFSSTRNVQTVSLNVGTRSIQGASNGVSDDITNPPPGTVKPNKFDKYLSALDTGERGVDVSFAAYCSENGVVPHFTHASLRAVWPLTEEYSYTMLILHKPVASYAQLKGSHESYVLAFKAFLSDPSAVIPDGLYRSLFRAVKQSVYGTGKSSRGSGRRRSVGGARGSSQAPPTPRGSDSDDEDDLFPIEIGDFEMDDIVRQAPLGYDPTNDDGSINRYQYGDLQSLVSKTQEEAQSYYASNLSAFIIPSGTEGREFADPTDCMNNEGQRFLICFYLDHIEKQRLSDLGLGEPPSNVRGMVSGQAGTGKSFTMVHLSSLSVISTGKGGAAIAVAPTGAAAGALAALGAATADRAFRFSRTAREYKTLDTMALTVLQEKYKDAICLSADEVSMWGQNMSGVFLQRLDDTLNSGTAASAQGVLVPQYGGVPFFLWYGDFLQLAPVLDSPLYGPRLISANKQIGKRGYDAVDSHFVLDTPVRQPPDGTYIRYLTSLRNGDAGGDIRFWSTRRLMNMTSVEKERFSLMDPLTLYCTCFNSDRNELNSTYMSQCQNMIIIKATCVGTHAVAADHPRGGLAKKIPRTNYLCLGMPIKLTTNIIPEKGLFNNSRGWVRDFYYTDGGTWYNPDDQARTPVVICEMPSYTGNPISPEMAAAGKGKYVAFSSMVLRCDCNACSRSGLPLVCAKADSIHSLQGVTIGDTKPFKRLVVKWSQQAESRWPNIFYVATSRTNSSENIALRFNITSEDLREIGNTDSWKKQHEEARRVTDLAFEFRNEKRNSDASWGSKEDYHNKLLRFISATENACTAPPGVIPTDAFPLLASAPMEIKEICRRCVTQWRDSLTTMPI